MKRGLIVLFIFLSVLLKADAFEVILPIAKKSVTTSNYAFFIGKAYNNEGIKINDNFVHTASNGAFAYSVKLKEGENRVLIRSVYGIQVYEIFKTTVKPAKITEQVFDRKKAVVISDNTPIRSTPVDAGLNRMGHLFAGTELLIDGERGDFYRVFLSSDKTGWIMKKHVNILDNSGLASAEFIDMKNERYKNAVVQTIEFTKNLPYTIEETENEIILRFYNPEKSDNSVYSLTAQKPKKYTYSLTSDNGKYSFKVRELPKNKSEITVAIDAGHGGSERGAIGCLGDEEKDINLMIADSLASVLRKKGVNVVMTRECDGFVSLDDRVNIAKENNADIFVSIHLNSIGDIPMDIHKYRGTSIYYYNNNSKELAEFVENSTTKKLKTKNDGVKTASLAVVRPSDYIGILVETAYMTNPLDSVLYKKRNFPQKAAEGISKGIIKYIESK